jgi:hypothetical protein
MVHFPPKSVMVHSVGVGRLWIRASKHKLHNNVSLRTITYYLKSLNLEWGCQLKLGYDSTYMREHL